jgi:hypothetical protein
LSILVAACGLQARGAAQVPNQPSIVTVGGHQLIVQKRLPDGSLDKPRPYVIHGVDWSPATRAPDYGPNPLDPSTTVQYGFFFDYPGRNPQGHVVMNYWLKGQPLVNVSQDVPLMQAMHVNTVRVYTDFGTDPSTYSAVLDNFYNAGIMVIMTVVGSTQDISSGQYLTAVNLAKNHPALLLWAVGNEWNLNNYYGTYTDTVTLNGAILLTRQAAQMILAQDANHPVSSVLGDRFQVVPSTNPCLNQLLNSDIPTIVQKIPEVAIWGINSYRGPTFTNLWQQWVAATSKPFYLSEFGTDSFATTSSTLPFSTPSCPDSRAKVTAGSEDQVTQANFDAGLWQEISLHLSAFRPGEPSAGGLVFEWNDEVWKVGNYNVGLGGLVVYCSTCTNYAFYDPDGYSQSGSAPDNILNAEYFGLVTADRFAKMVFQTLQSLFARIGKPSFVLPPTRDQAY